MINHKTNQKTSTLSRLDNVDIDELYEVVATCQVSGMTYHDNNFKTLQETCEDIEMYTRHLDNSKIKFSMERLNVTTFNSMTNIQKLTCITFEYSKNPFNAKLKSIHDSGGMLFDCASKEKLWVVYTFDTICKSMYEQYKANHSSKWVAPKYGSCVHRGLINDIFNRNCCSFINEVYDWCEIIGDCYDPSNLRKLQPWKNNESIYQIGYYTSIIKNICKYCEIMFNVNKFEVAKCFEKRSIEYFQTLEEKAIEKLKKNSYRYYIDEDVIRKRRYYKNRIACVHAEMNNHDIALKLLEECETMYDDPYYKGKRDELMKYIEINGTSILSSDN